MEHTVMAVLAICLTVLPKTTAISLNDIPWHKPPKKVAMMMSVPGQASQAKV